jgi:hypothetical protein
VAKVRHFVHPKHALGALDKQLVLLELGKNQMDMAQLFRSRGAIDQDVIKENEYKLTV